MNILIIGNGNVATVLARLIYQFPEHKIIGIAARNISSARILASEVNTDFFQLNNDPLPKADFTILTTSDSSLPNFEPLIFDSTNLLVHTAGAVSKDVLKKYTSKYGVLYPLQSLRKELEYNPRIPFLVDSNSVENTALLRKFCTSIASSSEAADDEKRLAMHTAAVVVSNFTNHLYALAKTFCENRGLNFDMLQPLIMETAARLTYASPSSLQTGPAIRQDLATIKNHLAVLDDHPRLKEIYALLTESILGSKN